MKRYNIKFSYKKMLKNDEYDIEELTREVYAFSFEDACDRLRHIHLGAHDFELVD